MKKKFLLFLLVLSFMTTTSLLLIPKTYAQAGYARDGWNIVTDDSGTKYTLSKDNANVETSGYSPNGTLSPFMLVSNNSSTDTSYTVSAKFKSLEEQAPEAEMGGVVKMGIVPYYKDVNNWFVVYMNWDNSISSDKMANVHINGQHNGEWYDYDLLWVHDNANSMYDMLKVPSNAAEFEMQVRVLSTSLIEVSILIDGEGITITNDTYFGFHKDNEVSVCGIYAYGSTVEARNLYTNSNENIVTYFVDDFTITDYFEGESYVMRELNYIHPLGYKFLGWSQDFNSTTVNFEAGESYNISGNWNFYPVWEIVEKGMITFYDNFSGASYTQEYILGEDFNLNACNFVRNGYVFDCWSVDSSNIVGQTFNNGSSMKITNPSLSLYANWRLIEFDEETIKEYVETNGYYSKEEYLQYGKDQYVSGMTEGASSVDITTDNQEAIDNYMEENQYYTVDEYLQYGDNKYRDGVASVDITKDNQAAIDSYLGQHGYHTYVEYLEYGDTKYQEGVESVDITTDNQAAIDKYIEENRYHTSDDYLEYGSTKYQQGYQQGVGSVDITTDNQEAIDNYILENNYHSDLEYIEYGEEQYQTGYTNGINSVQENTEDNTQDKDIGAFFVEYPIIAIILGILILAFIIKMLIK